MRIRKGVHVYAAEEGYHRTKGGVSGVKDLLWSQTATVGETTVASRLLYGQLK